MKRRTSFLRILLCSVLLLSLGVPTGPRALGQSPAQKKAEVEQARQTAREKLEQMDREEGSILEAMQAVDQSILEQQTQLEQLRERLSSVEQRIGGLEQERLGLEQGLAARRVQLQRRLRSLYKYSNKGFLQVLLSGGSGTELLKQMRYLQLIVRRDMGLIETQRHELARFGEVKQSLERERAEVKQLTRDLELQVAAAQEDQERKKTLLARIRTDRTLEERYLKELEAAAEALARTLEQLPKARPPVPVRVATTGGGPGPGGVAPGGTTAPGSGSGSGSSAPTPVADRAPGGGAAPGTTPAPVAAAPVAPAPTGFAAQRGRLPFPVPGGKVTRAYGRYKAPGMKASMTHKGLDIAAPLGSDILAIYDGQVVLAEWYKSYGLMLIVDHGDKFHSIYAHAAKLLKKPGDAVKTGERIAQVGDTGSFQGPFLYLEVREKGKEVNPIQWVRVPPDAMALEQAQE